MNIERIYAWVKKLDPTDKATFADDLDQALVKIKKIFNDNSITREVVELLFSETTEYKVKKASIEKIISEKNAEIKKLTDEISNLNAELDVVLLYIEDEKYKTSVPMSAILQAMYDERAKAVEKAREIVTTNEKVTVAEASAVIDTINSTVTKQAKRKRNS